MRNVVVVDYGMGNLLSVHRAFEYCGARVVITSSPNQVERAEYLVLPGVGAFADGIRELHSRGLVEAIRKFTKTGRPFLGICLGMQMMMETSEEFGIYEGLALIPGRVIMIPKAGSDGIPHKIPHIGWNGLLLPKNREDWNNTVFQDLSIGESVYFVHSFSVIPTNPINDLADCDYNGLCICASIQSGNVYGCQFHPEKSGIVGLKIIKNFLKIHPQSQ
ncbi:MAG: imidazole glycerol phosphate synthase subunit HisH [Proteobacteria bacterium]|nr:imidazole glycerol phosphate synthase subunit HisH [Pseudomonadota bacterium]